MATLAAVLGVLTIWWRDWIEALAGFDPGAHSGRAEWLIVAGLLLVAAAGALSARREYRRVRTRPA